MTGRIDTLIQGFHQRMVGQTVRGQKVSDVELVIDTIGGSPRFILHVGFEENPPRADAPDELKMLARIMSEIPCHAMIDVDSYEALVGILDGTTPLSEYDWRLEDE